MTAYEEYVEIFSHFEEKYQQLHKILHDQVGIRLAPLIAQYDADIARLQEESIRRAALCVGRERALVFSQLREQEKMRYDVLLDQAKSYVDEHDRKIYTLNAKLLLAKQVVLERRYNGSISK